MNYNLTVSELINKLRILKIGDRLLLSGTIYTARDAAHKRIKELLDTRKALPLELKDKIIYYCGPCPAKPGKIIGSCGPTTSARMDSLTPLVLSQGVKATIGKGPRSKETGEAFKKFGAVYLVATGGAGALLAERVKKSKVVAFEDLGPEAVYELEVEKFPVIVAGDVYGGDIFKRLKE